MATIKDIAQRTGYSITTISRVLNQDKTFNVSDETRLKIMTAAEEINYVPLSKRQKIKKKNQTLTLGLVYWYSVSEELIDPYYLSIRLAIEYYCETHQINFKRFHLVSKDFNELDISNLDGIIALGKYSQAEVLQLHRMNPTLVLVDCYNKHFEIDVVMANLEEATENIIDYFRSVNLDSIGFIGGVEKTLDGEVLQDARLTTFKQYENPDADSIFLGAFNADSGYEIMKQIIKTGKLNKAYVIASDSIAMGCLKALSEHDIKVPTDVSLISYDNISLSQYTIPALTTIDMNTKIMGETSVELLIERITTNRQIAKKIFIPTQLVKRGSSI